MMNQAEQTAFIDAYVFNVADLPREVVADFVTRFVNKEKINYGPEYTSIMDALCIWNSAAIFTLLRSKQ